MLGDLGRSPRTLYHALALADRGAEVDIVAFADTALPRELMGNGRVAVHTLPGSGSSRSSSFSLPAALARALAQAAGLFWTLLARVRSPHVILAQTPPPIPTLAVAAAAARLRGARLIVDWHNFGSDVLALKAGAGSRGVRWVRRAELRLAHRGDVHLAVSTALADRLSRDAGLTRITVFRDRPAARFSPALRREPPPPALQRLIDDFPGTRPAIAIAPGSWTLDEDVDLLLDAVATYDADETARPLLVLLSGDGPRKPAYAERIRGLTLRRSRVGTIWVPYEDYPALLAHADVGISIHRSASGVDLPMKIADMIGAGLPVLALDYPCLREELAGDGAIRLFTSASGLARALAGVEADRREPPQPAVTWDQEWARVCLPLVAVAGHVRDA